MARLWSDIRGTGQCWYDLDSAPGILSPGVGDVVYVGHIPIAVQPASVFRTPATATLTFNGQSVSSAVSLIPGVGSLTSAGQIPSELRQATVTPTYPPDYSTLPSALAPTILYIATITPTTGSVRISNLTLNVTQGGNILIVSPGVAALSIGGTQSTLIFSVIGLGGVTINGLAPSLDTQLTLSMPTVESITVNGLVPTVEIGFVWRDVEAPPALTWS